MLWVHFIETEIIMGVFKEAWGKTPEKMKWVTVYLVVSNLLAFNVTKQKHEQFGECRATP